MRQVIHAWNTDFEASDQDTSDPANNYFGFMDSNGRWIIQVFQISGGVINYRYAYGTTGYATAWANRATVAPNAGYLTYDYYSRINFL